MPIQDQGQQQTQQQTQQQPQQQGARVHWSFWLIGIIALIWNGMGSLNFVLQLDPEMVAAYRESERLIIQDRPAWATAGFGFAVFGGTVASLLLLLRKPYCSYFFVASTLGVVITIAHAISRNIDFGIGEIVGIILMPLLVAAFLLWYSLLARRKNWLG